MAVVSQRQHDAVEVAKDVGPGKMEEDAHARDRGTLLVGDEGRLDGSGRGSSQASERLDRVGDDRCDRDIEPARTNEPVNENADPVPIVSPG